MWETEPWFRAVDESSEISAVNYLCRGHHGNKEKGQKGMGVQRSFLEEGDVY